MIGLCKSNNNISFDFLAFLDIKHFVHLHIKLLLIGLALYGQAVFLGICNSTINVASYYDAYYIHGCIHMHIDTIGFYYVHVLLYS